MRKIVASAFLFVVVSGFLAAADLETRKRVPDGCIAAITVTNIQNDPGISWMIGSWLVSQQKSPLKELFKASPPQELSVAFFPESADKPMNLLAVAAMAKGSGPDKAKLDGVIKRGQEGTISTTTYKGLTISTCTGFKEPTDFASYAVYQNQVIFGADQALVQKAIDGPSVSDAANYKKIAAQSAGSGDALLFADNNGTQFARFLAPREKKWKMTLLLSAESLAYLGSFFDVVNSSKVVGTIIFQAADKSAISGIKDDAEFLGEAFKRKFMAEKIQYTGKVEVSEMTVKLTFQVEGLEPLWKRLFDKGVFDLFRPEP